MYKFNDKQQSLIQSIKDLTTSTTEKYDNVQKANSLLQDLLHCLYIPMYLDQLPIQSRETLIDMDNQEAKHDLDVDGYINSPTLQDLAFMDRNNDKYFYVNGYGRVELVTDDDIYCELSDALDFVNADTKQKE